jgi:hypothetical protein
VKVRHKNLKALFESVFWPAAAGNVFWSFASLLVENKVQLTVPSTWGSGVLLLLLSLYLSVEWLRNYSRIPDDVALSFWAFDWLHICAVVAVALSAALKPSLLPATSAVFFAITAVGHFAGVWKQTETAKCGHVTSAVINIVGAPIALSGLALPCISSWSPAIAFATVLALWSAHRWQNLRALFSTTVETK